MSREQELATAFVELADTLGDGFDVLDFLQNLVSRTTTIIGGAAAGLILADQRGDLQVVAATSHSAEVLELIAIAVHEGPCVDAFNDGRAVVNVLPEDAARRWPQFVQSAESMGYRSAQVVPMRMRSEVLGALSVFFTAESTLDEAEVTIFEALASVATIGLLQERTPRQREILAEQLQAALSLRVVIEQAEGVIAEVAGVDVDDAFGLLRAFAHRSGRTLSDVALRVLERRVSVDDLLGTR